MVFVPGWTINEFPAFANTRTLASTFMKSFFLKISFFLPLFSCNAGDNKSGGNNYGEFPDPKSSVIIYFSNTNHVELTKCVAEKRNDSIYFKITDSSSNYLLTILKVKEKLSVDLEQLFSITDSSYKKSIFTAVEQNLKLDKASYEKGDDLKGFLKLKLSVLHRWTELYTDTVSVSGLVYSTLR